MNDAVPVEPPDRVRQLQPDLDSPPDRGIGPDRRTGRDRIREVILPAELQDERSGLGDDVEAPNQMVLAAEPAQQLSFPFDPEVEIFARTREPLDRDDA